MCQNHSMYKDDNITAKLHSLSNCTCILCHDDYYNTRTYSSHVTGNNSTCYWTQRTSAAVAAAAVLLYNLTLLYLQSNYILNEISKSTKLLSSVVRCSSWCPKFFRLQAFFKDVINHSWANSSDEDFLRKQQKQKEHVTTNLIRGHAVKINKT